MDRSLLRRRDARRIVTAAVGLVAASAAPASADNFRLTAANCPACTAEQVQRFQFIVDNQFGVAGRDPAGEYIGIWPAKRYGFRNWFPQATYKQTLCGELARFGFYDGLGDEADWNEHMAPSAPFQRLVDEPLLRNGGNTDQWVTERVIVNGQPKDVLTVEGEITPDERFYESPWVSKEAAQSALEGHDLCMYGPWVVERFHNNKPEIHPAELHWWRAGSFAYLLTMQDDSNRFDQKDDFDLFSEPASWREWAQYPRTGEFRVAVSMNASRIAVPLGPPPKLEVSTDFLLRRNLNDPQDADDGTEHGVEFDGQLLLNVSEDLRGGEVKDGDVKVGFEFCRQAVSPLTQRLLGYVTLTTRVGQDDTGKEGVHLMKVRRVDTGPSDVLALPRARRIAVQAPPALQPEARWLLSSLRSERAAGRRRLVADLEIKVLPGSKPRAGDRVITAVRVRGAGGPVRRALRPGRARRSVRLTVPVTSTPTLEVVTQSRRRTVMSAPGIAPALRFEGASPSSTPVAIDPGVVAAALGVPGGAVTGATRVRQWTSGVDPQYAAVRDGVPSPEDDTPVAEEINEVLERSPRRTRTLFGTTRPLPVRWSFSAVDAVSGQNVAVRLGRPAGAGEIAVRRSSDEGGIAVTFPDTGAVYRLTARASTRDPFGSRATTRHVISNVTLTAPDPAALVAATLPAVARLAGVAPGLLTAESPVTGLPPTDPNPADVARGRVRAVGLLAYQAAADRQVDLFELERLLGAARLVESGG